MDIKNRILIVLLVLFFHIFFDIGYSDVISYNLFSEIINISDLGVVMEESPNTNIADDRIETWCNYPDIWGSWDKQDRNSYVKFNISSILGRDDILNISLVLDRTHENSLEQDDTWFYYVWYDDWNNTITWNTQPCGNLDDFDNTTYCNISGKITLADTDPESINVTDWVLNETENNEEIISFGFETEGVDCGVDRLIVWDKNNAHLLIWINETVINRNMTICIDNQTLQINRRLNITVNGSLSVMVKVSVKKCNWGCDNVTHSCNPNPVESNLIMVLIILGVPLILFIVLKKSI